MDLKNPPKFDGTNFGQWKMDIRIWDTVTDVPASKRGLLVAMNCTGDAKLLVNTLDFEKMKSENGLKYIFEQLRTEFQKPEIDTLYHKYSSFMSLKRTGTLEEYCNRFKQLARDLNATEITIPEYLLSLQFILNAELSTDQRAMILTVVLSSCASYKEFKLDNVIYTAKQLLSESCPLHLRLQRPSWLLERDTIVIQKEKPEATDHVVKATVKVKANEKDEEETTHVDRTRTPGFLIILALANRIRIPEQNSGLPAPLVKANLEKAMANTKVTYIRPKTHPTMNSIRHLTIRRTQCSLF